ncbi:MAG: DedA family protein [Planctomycetota bacterium]|nr:DedA family protein [Planctomycetota bacterium]
MPCLLAQSLVRGLFEDVGYLAPFLILFLAGCGLPVPEEVTMVGSGFLVFRGEVEFLPIVLTCYTATLLGDSVPFWLGRRYGMSALRFRWVAKMIHPERMALLEERFDRHGNWAVFTCRFLPGVRLPGWFLAGTLGMSYPRFLLIDGIAAAIMTPLWVLIGRAAGGHIDQLESTVQDLHQWLGFGVLALGVTLVIWMLVRRHERQVIAQDGEELERPGEDRKDP